MRKLAIFTLAFACGTLLGQYLLPGELLPWAALGCALLVPLCLLCRGRKRKRFLLLTAGLCLSLLYFWAYSGYVRGTVERYAGEEVPLTLTVTGYAEEGGVRCRIPVRVVGAGFLRDGAMLYGDEDLYALEPGDQVTGLFTVNDAATIHDTPITSFTAKGRYLMLFPNGELTAERPEYRGLSTLPARIAHWLGERVEEIFSSESAPFLKALLLGDDSGFTEEQESDLSETGLYHITAVSGMHFGYLFMMLSFLVGIHRPRRLAAVTVPVVLLYMLLVGASASVVRACIMMLFVLAGPLLGRESDSLTSLSAALLALLIANPLSIAGVGLQLSFASMVGLLVLAPRIFALLPAGRNALWRFVRSSLAASLGATICTAPLTAFYFNRIPLVGPVANILVGTAATFTFLSGAAALALGLIAPVLGSFVGLLPQAGVWYILAVARLFARIPYHAIYFTNPYLKYWLVFLVAIFGYCALTPKGRRKYLLATGLAAGTLALLLYFPVYGRAGRLHAVAVDVGQGASTVLASQGATALVDCGSSESFINAGDEAGDTLNTYGYFGLDYLILTHYHDDHANGIGTLLARVPVDTILVPTPETADAAIHEKLVALVERYGCTIAYVTEDTHLPLGRADLQVFAPIGQGGTNEEGLTILCTAGDFDLLITGDMNSANEAVLAERKELPDIEVLLVGHHGSRDASSTALLRTVTPEVGIISVGADNTYGHPTDEALRRLVGMGAEIYRTDRQGSVSIVLHE